MALVSAYTSPGVTVTEATTPTVATLLPIPNAIAIVGTASGTQSATESAILTGTTAYTLRNTGVASGTVTVYNITTASGIPNTAYSVALSSDPNSSITGDEVYTVSRSANAGALINSGDTVRITYNYTDQYYYEPTLFNNYADVTDKYGQPFDGNGNINSQLAFAIRMAFLNGATEVIGVAINNNDLSGALNKLLDIEEIAFVSVVSGNASDHAAALAHCTTAATNYGLYRQCVVGRDSSSTAISQATLQAAASALNDGTGNAILISPSSFNITNPVTLRPYAIGAQYAASAVLGMFAARDATVPLTRKTVAGFTSPNETRTTSQAASDSAAGLFVVEYKGGVFRVRHGVTTMNTDTNKREASVVRAKYALAYELKNSLDGLIGIVVSPSDAPLIVVSNVTSLLSQLVGAGLIASFQNVSARLLNNPTTVEVRFEYTPLYPINNINVVFTINTQTGGFALTQQ